jgi:hypothetical protein
MKDLGSGKRTSDELEGKNSDKQGETCSIIETKLGLQAKSWCVLRRPLLAPLYRWLGLEVLVGFDTNPVPMAVLYSSFLIQIFNTWAPILGYNLRGP